MNNKTIIVISVAVLLITAGILVSILVSNNNSDNRKIHDLIERNMSNIHFYDNKCEIL